jgi:hypothetical protein
LNRKCGRIRDCSSASRAVVSAGHGRLGAQAQPLEHRRRDRRAGERRAEPAERGEARAAGVDEQDGDERRRQPGGDRAEADRGDPLQRDRRGGERPLQRAEREQPDQHARQGDARPAAVRPSQVLERRRGEDHADRHHAVHVEQRTQHDADMADVERRIGPTRGGGATSTAMSVAMSKLVAPKPVRTHAGTGDGGAHLDERLADRIAAGRAGRMDLHCRRPPPAVRTRCDAAAALV